MAKLPLLMLPLLCGAAAAQTIALRDDPERYAQIVDLQPLFARLVPEGQTEAATDAARQYLVEGVCQLLRRFAAPALTERDCVNTAGPTRLVLVGTSSQQERWNALLAAWRTATPGTVTVTVDLYRLPTAAAATLRDVLGDADLVHAPAERVLPADTDVLAFTKKLVEAASASATPFAGDAETLRQVSIEQYQKVDYVRDWNRVKQPDGTECWAESRDQITAGTSCEFVAGPLPDGRLAIWVATHWLELQQPIPKFATVLPDRTPIVVDLPCVTVRRPRAITASRPSARCRSTTSAPTDAWRASRCCAMARVRVFRRRCGRRRSTPGAVRNRACRVPSGANTASLPGRLPVSTSCNTTPSV